MKLIAFASCAITSTCSGDGKQNTPRRWRMPTGIPFVEALQKYDFIEYLLDILTFGDEPERASLLTEYREEVNRIERRITDYAEH